MMTQPTLNSARLTLHPFTLEDAAIITVLAGDKRVSEMTASIPHPYSKEMALQWIAGRESQWQSGHYAYYAITLTDSGDLIGAVSLMESDEPDQPQQAELGYWIGVPYWGKGYATEAAQTLIQFGFETLDFRRIVARHLSRNPASGTVLTRCGFQHLRKTEGSCGEKFEALDYYEMIKPDPTH